MAIDHRDDTIFALDQGRAALNPVAAVIIRDAAELPDGRAMDVATEDGVHTVAFRVMHHSGFEFADKTHRVLHTSFRIGAERPVAKTKASSDEIDKRIEREQKLITNIAGEREPFHVLHHGVQLMAMNN